MKRTQVLLWITTCRLEIGKTDNNIHAANICYTTMGLVYIYYWSDNVKLVCWYEWVKNEKTSLTGFNRDIRDDLFTFRMHYKF